MPGDGVYIEGTLKKLEWSNNLFLRIFPVLEVYLSPNLDDLANPNADFELELLNAISAPCLSTFLLGDVLFGILVSRNKTV